MATKTRTAAQTPSPTGLYWNERGHVGCAEHVPYEGTDTWIWERWEPVTVTDALQSVQLYGTKLRCETCQHGR